MLKQPKDAYLHMSYLELKNRGCNINDLVANGYQISFDAILQEYLSINSFRRYFPDLSFSKHLQAGTVSLVKGRGDLWALGVYLAASTNWMGGPCIYMHGSIIPDVDLILKLIKQLQPDIPVICTPDHYYRNYFSSDPICYWIPKDANNSQYLTVPCSREKYLVSAKYSAFPQNFPLCMFGDYFSKFSWQIFPLPQTWMQSISATFSATKASDVVQKINDFSLIFLSGFDFAKDEDLQRKTLNVLRKKKCAVVLIDIDGRCDPSKIEFDNIFTCTLKRKTRSNRNLVIDIQTKSGKQMPVHVCSPNDHILWAEQVEKYSELEPIVAECVKQGMTAKEIIAYLKNYYERSLTMPTLARMKRKWGIRTYRKEKKPRVRKKRHEDSSSPTI